jgi:anthranilate synthase component II
MGSGLLIIDNYDSFTWNLVHLIREVSDISLKVVKNDRIQLNSVGGYDKILFSPGPGLPQEIPIMREIIEEFKNSKSILGICLGHQAIAEAVGCKIKNLSEVYHGTQHTICLTNQKDSLFSGIPRTFKAGLYHSWTIDSATVPEELKVTAVSEKGHIMAISHKTKPLKGVQFHPESYMTEYGKQLIANWLDS